MKQLLLTLGLLFALPTFGQTTLVSGTIQDSSGQNWAGGNIQFVFYPAPTNPSGPYTWSGGAFNPSQPIPATGKIGLNASGSFSGVSVPDNNTILPSGSQWAVTVCPAATATCYSVTMTITGPTLNLSSLVIPPPISVNASNFVFLAAYQDTEIVNAPLGASYFNLTSETVRVCAGPTLPCTWENVGGGGGSGCVVGGTATALLYDTGTGCADSEYLYTVNAGIPVLTGTSTAGDVITVGQVAGAETGFGSLNATTHQAVLMGYFPSPTLVGFLEVNDSVNNFDWVDEPNQGLVIGPNGGPAVFQVEPSGAMFVGNSVGTAGGVLTTNGAGSPPSWSAPSSTPTFTKIFQSATKNFAGTCGMLSGTTCTFTLTSAYTGTPICIVTAQGTSVAAGVTACSVSGTTVTITAANSNTNVFGAVIIGNPN
jgi:hypothetical protein